MEKYLAGRANSHSDLMRATAARSDERPGSPRQRRGGSERRKWKQIVVASRARDRYSRRSAPSQNGMWPEAIHRSAVSACWAVIT